MYSKTRRTYQSIVPVVPFFSLSLSNICWKAINLLLQSMCMPTSIQDAKKEFHNAAQQRSISIDTCMVIVHFRYIFMRKILEKVIKPIFEMRFNSNSLGLLLWKWKIQEEQWMNEQIYTDTHINTCKIRQQFFSLSGFLSYALPIPE